MIRRELLGYIMRQEVTHAIQAEQETRKALREVLQDGTGPRLQAMCLAEAALKLGTLQESLMTMREIINGNFPDEAWDLFEKFEEWLRESELDGAALAAPGGNGTYSPIGEKGGRIKEP